MDTALRVALYRRVSTVGHGQDVDVQLDELQAVAKQRGWNVVGDYVDDGISGTKESRPALDRLLKDVGRGGIDLVAVVRLDRLGRSLAHLLRLLDQITAHGCGFVSVRDAGIDTSTATGKLMLCLMGAFAEFERNLIKERIAAGVRTARSKGTKFGRPVRADIDPARVHRLRASGHSLSAIAEMLGCGKGTVARIIARTETPHPARALRAG